MLLSNINSFFVALNHNVSCLLDIIGFTSDKDIVCFKKIIYLNVYVSFYLGHKLILKTSCGKFIG